MQIYGDAKSGNCYKLKLLCALLAIEHDWVAIDILASDDCSLADISLYAYTHVAKEGGFELSKYPAIRSWITRIQGLQGYVGMND